MPSARVFRSQLLPVAEQVQRDDGLGRQTPACARGGEHAAEAAPCGIGAGERRDAGSAAKKVVTAPARRELVRHMKERGLSERHALRVLEMSASALRYSPAPDRDGELRDRI